MRRAARVTSPHFSVSYSTQVKYGGTAVVVPKKAVPSAVKRTHMKRRLRALLIPYTNQTGALVVYLRPGIANTPFTHLREELLLLLKSLPNNT